MDKLAHIQFLDGTGKDVDCRAVDIQRVEETPGGCLIRFDNGLSMASNNTVAEIHTLIDTLWDEYTTALGNPA